MQVRFRSAPSHLGYSFSIKFYPAAQVRFRFAPSHLGYSPYLSLVKIYYAVQVRFRFAPSHLGYSFYSSLATFTPPRKFGFASLHLTWAIRSIRPWLKSTTPCKFVFALLHLTWAIRPIAPCKNLSLQVNLRTCFYMVLHGSTVSILKTFHILHVSHNHQRNLKCDRILKHPQIKPRTFLELVKTVYQRVSVYKQLP